MKAAAAQTEPGNRAELDIKTESGQKTAGRLNIAADGTSAQRPANPRKERASTIQLMEAVLDCSKALEWKDAVLEWKITAYEEVDNPAERQTCVCGHEGLRYCYEITNTITGEKLFPIGSSCIKKFGRKDLSDQVNMTGKLAAAFKNIRYGTYDLQDFSPSMLKYLYENYAKYDYPVDKYGNWDDAHVDEARLDQQFDVQRLLEYRRQRSELYDYQKEDIEEKMKSSLTPVLVRWANDHHVTYLCIGDCLPYTRFEKRGTPGLGLNIPYQYKDVAKAMNLGWDKYRRCWVLPNNRFVEQACTDIRILSKVCNMPISQICPDSMAINKACARKGIGKTKIEHLENKASVDTGTDADTDTGTPDKLDTQSRTSQSPENEVRKMAEV